MATQSRNCIKRELECARYSAIAVKIGLKCRRTHRTWPRSADRVRPEQSQLPPPRVRKHPGILPSAVEKRIKIRKFLWAACRHHNLWALGLRPSRKPVRNGLLPESGIIGGESPHFPQVPRFPRSMLHLPRFCSSEKLAYSKSLKGTTVWT